MDDLRRAVIKLAHEKPELRPHLLPLVKKTAVGAYLTSQAQTKARRIGQTGNGQQAKYFLETLVHEYADLLWGTSEQNEHAPEMVEALGKIEMSIKVIAAKVLEARQKAGH